MLALAPNLCPPPPAQGRPDQPNYFDNMLGQRAVHTCTDNLTTFLYSVQCRCLSLARQPTKRVTKDPTPTNTPSEDILTPHNEYSSVLVRCQAYSKLQSKLNILPVILSITFLKAPLLADLVCLFRT